MLFRLWFVGHGAFCRYLRKNRRFRCGLSFKRSLSRNFNVCIRALEFECAKMSG